MKFSGFMNVYLLEDMSWEYQFDDKSLKAPTLKELEVLVSLYGLKSHSLEVLKMKVIKNGLIWKETDKDLAYKNLKLDSRKFK